ncbi:MAG: NADH-quinone oxidoreductase subunit F [Microthrixaceae bacterium]|nr:NADH-quinone oxidoreductase subunit F [Microthrixaceae bacterium]
MCGPGTSWSTATSPSPAPTRTACSWSATPHQLIEGCLIAAYAIGAAQVFLYVRGEMAHAQERIAAALNEAYEANLVGRNILGTDFSVDIVLTWGAGAYIVGEETALIESLEGHRGCLGSAAVLPGRQGPLHEAHRGQQRGDALQPAVDHEPRRHEVPRHRHRDLARHTSHRPVGPCAQPRRVRGPQGSTTFRDLIESPDYGGGIREGHELKMFIPGGASAPWFFPEHLDLPLEAREVGPQGSMLGSGAVVVMDDSTDAVRACLRVVRFFARESCGKCTPCREGTTWEEQILTRILEGHGRPSDIELLLDVADNISPGPYPVASHEAAGLDAVPFPPRQTTICPLGPSSVAPITSALRRFRSEFTDKITLRDPIPVVSEPSTNEGVRNG